MRTSSWTFARALPRLVAVVMCCAPCVACGDDSAGTPDAAVDADVADGSPADGAAGDDGAVTDCTEHVVEDAPVPLSDGKSLAALVRRPVNPACRLPTVLIQTPYNKEGLRSLWIDGADPGPLFESPHYAFVVTDWRGFFGSSGAAVAQPDYGQDGYDAVEWIAAQPWSDGQVATWGVSALGRVQYWTATRQPPHLVACVPIFSPMNTTYEEYYPGGVLRREFVDTLGLLYGNSVVEQHPFEDIAWQWLATTYDPADVQVPMLVVVGWYDLDNARSFRTWDALVGQSDPAARDAHRLLVGAWHHFAAGGETTGAGRQLTAQELIYHDGERRIQADSLAFFDHHLRGIAGAVPSWERVRYVRDGEGSWEGVDTWPPATASLELFLDSAGALSAAAPGAGALDFAFDPDDPSPTIGGQTLAFDLWHGPHDQADVIARDDALVFVGEPLAQPLRIRGPLEVRLAVSTTGADTDLVVRVTDVDADGAHLLLADGVRRLSLRNGFGAPEAVAPGQRYAVTVSVINQLAYTFAAGHRVGLIVTSSNHPRFSRNPGNGDTFYTDAATSVTVTNTLHLDGESRLILPADE